ncbi:MAG: SDR family NAD(P)-dependent oxidoreductase [Clostridiales bacterium]|jgi:acyl transferase domain-containing protein/NAD(P)H-dependent flavin oxidoreductase YrpB (nitropropane dioxygenase family)/NAD(P)-dependent dehydrogenase (short-subunit alcohol dehydrogenase family)|nr:SDR family NAD(P)-dependent oxidoreductase [Clostridiales bacterium]
MKKECVDESQVWIVTPFERPDAGLASAAAKAGAFPVLHLGRDRAAAEAALNKLTGLTETFGVCFADRTAWDIPLPSQVSKIILPWGMNPPKLVNAEIIWQVLTAKDAEEALAAGMRTLILKGCEGAGLCGGDSSFILFQKLAAVCKNVGAAVFVQGGVGVHTAAAYFALGAAGVVMDSQAALFPECGLSQTRKTVLRKLSGNEIRVCEGRHYYIFPGSDALGDISNLDELHARTGAAESDVLPLGQDVILGSDLAGQYKKLKNLVCALKRAASSHVKQARIGDAFSLGCETADSLGTVYPIAQGPMTRISDTPEFILSVADAGALPFFALSMMTGNAAESALICTAAIMRQKPWGVGILGFIHPSTLEEQTKLILKIKPPFVLIAGGHPAQAKVFERAGITVLLHAPAPGLLDMFLKEGLRTYIFEGRESGGHVGPLFSAVLWEKQINRLLQLENASGICAFFAGGIHDSFSAAFVRVMTGPLTPRGVKVGLLCGTAYLYTKEALQFGAISEAYQRKIVEQDSTLLLKSGAGQETRCVSSPYTDFFLAEKAQMEKEGLDTGEILLKLEDLNLGRLRAASKGFMRVDGALVSLTEEEQIEKGLYMTGAITALTNKTTTIAELHENLIAGSLRLFSEIITPEPLPEPSAPSDAAVIGMAGIFPKAADIDEFWRNIIFGRDCIMEVPEERWPADLFFDPNTKDTDHVVSKWGGFIDKTDFDALEFGVTPQSLSAIEPVQLLSLLVAKRALEDAGFTDLSHADLGDTAVIFGAQSAGDLAASYGARAWLRVLFGELPKEMGESLPRLTEDSFPGVLGNVIAGRISNRLNTGGRNFTVDAACASSLAALDIALSELDTKRADMVVLGGADLHNGINDFLMFSSTHALSRKGRCATFDADADGIALGEGVGVIILKRLEDAQRDGNKIYAVIKSAGGASDAKSLGLTAPSRSGQVHALELAYERAGVRPSNVGLIESHGTGTVVGDRIEMRALTDVFLEDGAQPGQTLLGSLKSQIGHTKCAAGVAGLIKIINCVRHGILPATLHLNQPNEAYTKNSPFAFRTEKAGYWRAERRIAGVSGFGFGGTNFHAIVENYEPDRPAAPLKAWPSELFIFPGETAEEAADLMDKVVELFTAHDKLRLRDVAYSLAARLGGQPVQFAIVAGTRDELLARMQMARQGIEDENIRPLKPVAGKVAFLFPGQGSQRVNMAADLFIVFPQMRRILHEWPEYERILYPDAVFTDAEKREQREKMMDTRNAQPLLGIVDLAIAELLREFGITPDMAAGHSYGELPALCFAGAFDAENLTKLSRARAEAILAAAAGNAGRMAAVFTNAQTLTELLDGAADVWPVNFNAPRQTVVAGTDAGMDAFLQKTEAAGVSCKELSVACAFHSPLLKGADGTFAAILQEIDFHAPAPPVWSNTDAEAYPITDEGIKRRLAAHLVNPVYFREEIEKMSEDGAAVFVEAGPGGALGKLVSEILLDKPHAVIQTERGGAEGLTFFLQGLAKYMATGRMIQIEKLYEGREAAMLNLDKPSLYKKNGTVWNIDGQAAVPENGDLPSHAGRSLSGSVALLEPFKKGLPGGTVEQIMMAYLDNMNAMIQDQRDVMLGYLGAPEIVPRANAARGQSDWPAVLDAEVPTRSNYDSDGKEYPPETNETAGLPDVLSLTTEQITGIIFDIVSEKTGYPVDMLDLDMDLEADLSIDSIKKMDIIGELRNRIQLPEIEDGMNMYFEKMISMKKFRDLIMWIEKIGRAVPDSLASDGAASGFERAQLKVDLSDVVSAALLAQIEDIALKDNAPDIVRMTLVETARPIEEIDVNRVAGKTFAVTDDGNGLAVKAAESLREKGAEARIIPPLINANPENFDLSGCDGLILINSSAGQNRYTVFDLFSLLKRADMDRLQWALVFDDSFAAALTGCSEGVIELPEGFPGFFKSLIQEYPGKQFSAVEFETIFDPETFAGIVIDELTAVKFFPEIIYRNGERSLLLPEISTVKTGEAAQDVLDEESVVAVLGGAQGITPHIVARMAKDMPCRYILLGRSVREPEDEKYAAFETVDEIRKYLIDVEGMKQPREIEAKAKRIFKSSRIAASVARIEQAGGKAAYRKADVTDAEGFAAALAEIKNEYGRIDGVIHAAGILEDKLFRDKEPESFARVYQTKTLPLKTALQQLYPELKLLVMFSSMSAAFGNAGQCDYAAGNSALDIAARILKRQNPALKVTTFGWGPWKGAGMVDSGLEIEFRKKGISFIELGNGSEFFVNELQYADETTVLAIAGDETVMSDFLKTVF